MTAPRATLDVDPQFDPKFLDAYTGGDHQIRDQVLTLFLEQASLLLQRLEDSRGNARAWMEVAHSLKGCAAGVGAAGIAALARVAEKGSAEPEAAQLKMIEELRSAVDATTRRVNEVIARSAN